MSELTSLERAMLEAFRQPEAKAPSELLALLATASVRNRDNTGYGFYTEFDVDRTLPPLDLHPMVDGPVAHLVGLGDDNIMASILWLEDGYPKTLEGYQYGDATGQNADLHETGLERIVFSRIEWPELQEVIHSRQL